MREILQSRQICRLTCALCASEIDDPETGAIASICVRLVSRLAVTNVRSEFFSLFRDSLVTDLTHATDEMAWHRFFPERRCNVFTDQPHLNEVIDG